MAAVQGGSREVARLPDVRQGADIRPDVRPVVLLLREKYVPKGYGTATGAEPGVGPYCPSCGRELLYIREYDRYYCREERKYARKGLTRRPP